MAKEFLARTLTIENSVTSEGNQDCIICREKYGILSPENGTMELEVRLPCKHTVGSACIASWLAENNNCPLCRHEFFPRQRRPYMGHEMVLDFEDGEDDYVQRFQDENDEDYLSRLARRHDGDIDSENNSLYLAIRYSDQLNLGLSIAFLALNIADCADGLPALDYQSKSSVAAASVYVASHILREPRSLADIARLTFVSVTTLHDVYRAIYFNRYQLIDEDWRQIVGGATLGEAAEAVPSLTWPPLECVFSNGNAENEERMEVDDGNRPSALDGFDLVEDLCFEFKFPGEENLDNIIWVIARKVAHSIESMTLDWKTESPWTIAAACTYMASHLVVRGKSFEQVSAASGVHPARIHNTYAVMYGVREQIVQGFWFRSLVWTRENTLTCLPEP